MFDPIKIRLDLEMPLPPGEEKEHEEYDECELCEKRHDPMETCDTGAGFNNGPIPELFFGKPVVQSEYLDRVKKLEEKRAVKEAEDLKKKKKKEFLKNNKDVPPKKKENKKDKRGK